MAVALGTGLFERHTGIALSSIKCVIKEHKEEHFRTQEARTQLSSYFKELTQIASRENKKRLIFFIDDLDRCRPENALKLLEALKLYLNIKGCVYFLGVDHTALKHVIKEAFQGIDQHEIDYLDKIVQLPFHIPPIDLEKGMKEYVDELVKSERLEPCKEMLINCLGDNPRQVKRFINTLTLNDLLAKEILKEEYDPKILAFVLLIQLLNHALFRRLIRDYHLLRAVVATGGEPEETWDDDVKAFYNDHFATDERLRTALTMVGKLPELEVLQRYLYLTKAAGMVKEPEAASQLEILTQILEDHNKWLTSDGKKGERADLEMAKLEGANLRQAVLRRANLRGANLEGADLLGTDLREAELIGANLRGADLQGANLRMTNLEWANLREGNLQKADLRGANLRGANLEGADLLGTDLREAENLIVDQLAVAKTLFEAKLDPELEEELRKKHPHLLEPPEDM